MPFFKSASVTKSLFSQSAVSACCALLLAASASCAAPKITLNATTTNTLKVVPALDNTRPATCAFSAVQAAVTAALPGQTVTIPAGTCDWGGNQLSIAAGIFLKGAGIDVTVLKRSGAVAINTYLVRFDCGNGKQAKFSDMTLVGANLPYSEDRGLGLINGCVDFVVSNTKFTKFVFAGVEVRGAIKQRGVIYNSQFIDNYNATVHNLGYGIVVFGDGTWPALELGSANAVFVENNFMSGNRHHIAANNSSRYVFRRNTAVATDLTKDFPQVDAHGLSSARHGTRSWEVYENRFSATLSKGRNFAAIGMRGGDGVIFHNTYTSNIANPIALILEDAACGTYPVQDQINHAYVVETVSNPVTSMCEASIARNREYFMNARPAYVPYRYPHPLHAS